MNENERAERSRSGAWLQALMLREPGRWSSRLAALWLRLRSMGRGQRRRLGRAAAGTLAGASGIALMALLAGPMAPPVHAATINVDATCSLADAIKSANTDTAIGTCEKGSGDDTIILSGDVNLDVPYYYYYLSNAGLPLITSTITIQSSASNKFTVARDAAATEKFRIFTTANSTGNLTLRNLTISNGYAYSNQGGNKDGEGGGVKALANLTLDGVTFSGNTAFGSGGAVSHSIGTITVTNSTFSGNVSVDDHGGAILNFTSPGMIVTGSKFYDNEAPEGSGGAIRASGDSLVVSDTIFKDNYSSSSGGGLRTSSRATLTDVLFDGNESTDNRGGGLTVGSKVVTVTNGTFVNNTAFLSGGAIYAGGPGTDFRVISSTITTNDAPVGGGVFINDTALGVIAASTVSGNNASKYGGGLYSSGQTVVYVSDISGNTAEYYGGGIFSTGQLLVYSSTIANNTATMISGGGIYSTGQAQLINTTVSGNAAAGNGGGILSSGIMALANVTVAQNTADGYGGGIRADAGMSVDFSIVSGNTGGNNGQDLSILSGQAIAASYSVLGDSAKDDTAAFEGTVTDVGDNIRATSDGDTPTSLNEILDPNLADNGGYGFLPGGDNTLTHALVDGSPAVDILVGGGCPTSVDQRGEARPYGEGCDAGAYEGGLPGVDTAAFISTWAPGTIISGSETLTYNQLDILAWDGEEWTKWFDGIDAGLNPDAYKPNSRWKHNINAMSISDTETVQVFMSFTQNDEPVPGIPGRVDGMDVVLWDGDAGEEGEWSLIFNGNLPQIGLTHKTQEKIDGLHVMAEAPDWSEFSGDNCEAYLLISTQGPGLVPKPGNVKPKNVLKFGGEDVLGFCATNLGINTTGFWEMVLDGSAEGVGRNNIDSISLSEDGSMLYLTSKKAFNVDGAFGGHSMVFAFDMADEYPDERGSADGDFSGPYLRFMDDLGIQPKVDALHINGELELP